MLFPDYISLLWLFLLFPNLVFIGYCQNQLGHGFISHICFVSFVKFLGEPADSQSAATLVIFDSISVGSYQMTFEILVTYTGLIYAVANIKHYCNKF